MTINNNKNVYIYEISLDKKKSKVAKSGKF